MKIRRRPRHVRTVKHRVQDWLDRTVNLPEPKPATDLTILLYRATEVSKSNENLIFQSVPQGAKPIIDRPTFEVELEVKNFNREAIAIMTGDQIATSSRIAQEADRVMSFQRHPFAIRDLKIINMNKLKPFNWMSDPEMAS